MTTVQSTYLGWEQPEHLASCKRPTWSVDFRTDEDEIRGRDGGDAHACANDECQHGDRYPQITVRIVCTSCQAAVVIRGEHGYTSRGMTANTTYGYGLPPRKLAGLLLWPGEPFLDFGRQRTDEPYDLLVTRLGVKRVTRENTVGVIMQTRGKRGAVTWSAAVGPRDSKYLRGRIDWSRHSGDDATLRTVTAAAKWIAAQLASSDADGGAS
ncbi:hypothetical protein [Streptomyces sp. HGB0020]|uniref:hypothetical protein n=1 Tax=Streptomyces sp. HGB0020 TaxID=1078086 RepID=UPI00034E18FA|nr:hypothetical protein [Streptomyces sp. HGB0020]EPD63143.1 hypothetical protein HMPREF1211_03484 [Streptomyces sp. HGB0020]